MITRSFVKACAPFSCKEGFSVVGEAADGLEAMEKIRSLSPTSWSWTSACPPRAAQRCREVHKFFPQVKVILLSQHTEDMYIADALEACVAAYVLKSRLRAILFMPSSRYPRERSITVRIFRQRSWPPTKARPTTSPMR